MILEPPPGTKWHNPEEISSPGKGFRFVLDKELNTGMKGETCCGRRWDDPYTDLLIKDPNYTYRVPESTPFNIPQPTDDWTPWAGGECPVDAKVWIKYRDGDVSKYFVSAKAMRWNHGNNGGDIIAYKLAEQPKAEWTLKDHLAFHFPSLDISKVHMADKFVEGDLEDGERPCLADEAIHQVDSFWFTDRWIKFARDYTDTFGSDLGVPQYKCKTRRPLPATKPAWSLTEHLKQHFPSWGDRKAHREDFTEEMLSGGWRPFFAGETGDGEILYSDGWNSIKSFQLKQPAAKHQDHQRTKRPLPSTLLEPPAWSKGWHNPANLKVAGEGFRFCVPEELDGRHKGNSEYWCEWEKVWKPAPIADISKSSNRNNTYRVKEAISLPDPPSTVKTVEAEKPYRPKKGDWTEWRIGSNGTWCKFKATNDDYSHLHGYEFRPASPPDKGLDLTAGGITETPDPDYKWTGTYEPPCLTASAGQLLNLCLKYEPEPTENNTMQTTPKIGQKWTVTTKNGLDDFTGIIVGNEPDVLIRTGWRKRLIVIPAKEWETRPKSQINAKAKDEERAATGPSLLKRWRNYAAVFAAGTLLSKFTIPLAIGAYLHLSAKFGW